MQTNKNGIAVYTPKKQQQRKQLEYALDMIEFYQVINGIRHTILVPKFSHLRNELKKDGWRVSR